jgi:hypothetical protein
MRDAAPPAPELTATIDFALPPVNPPLATVAAICHVPDLRGVTLARARLELHAAGCALGSVTLPHRPGHGRLVVRRQAVHAGQTRRSGTHVAVTLGT